MVTSWTQSCAVVLSQTAHPSPRHLPNRRRRDMMTTALEAWNWNHLDMWNQCLTTHPQILVPRYPDRRPWPSIYELGCGPRVRPHPIHSLSKVLFSLFSALGQTLNYFKYRSTGARHSDIIMVDGIIVLTTLKVNCCQLPVVYYILRILSRLYIYIIAAGRACSALKANLYDNCGVLRCLVLRTRTLCQGNFRPAIRANLQGARASCSSMRARYARVLSIISHDQRVWVHVLPELTCLLTMIFSDNK